ncbi:NADPH-dependent FMN reductase [Nocardia sp. NPDC051030]|uniref:NADPH-dependent FMN reductase n=1 Tax=Nocardia sp. NPDC051030 TaxID=3155162 RepID=UPI00342A175B
MTTTAPELRVLALSGSLRADSYNTALLRAAQKFNPGGMTIDIYPSLGELPLYNQDLEAGRLHWAVEDLRYEIARADALLIATPEHNACIPAVLKSAIDWMSRTPDSATLPGKPVGLVGATLGALGTVRAQQSLRQILTAVGADVLAKPEVMAFRAHERFDADGNVTDGFTQTQLIALLDALAERTHRIR